MKQVAALVLVSILSLSCGYAQITKGNWLVGGTGRYASQKQNEVSLSVKGNLLQISPNVGYFPVDKFAFGLKPSLTYNKITTTGRGSSSTTLQLGPFVRYYFLPKDNQVNILAQAAYQYLVNFIDHSKSNTFSFSAGPVIYFNSSVGLELTANYDLDRTISYFSRANTFYIAIGFQIHLEKDKDD